MRLECFGFFPKGELAEYTKNITVPLHHYVAKFSHLFIADNKNIFSIFFKISVKGFESNLSLEGEDSKSSYAPFSSFFGC